MSGRALDDQAALLRDEALSQGDADLDGMLDHPLPAWRVSDTPLVLIAGAEVSGDSLYLYRVTGGAFTPDGGFVVAVGGLPSSLNALLYFDGEGFSETMAGRTGEGPGEFQTLGDLFHYGEGLAVMDRRLRRASWYTMEGELVGMTSLQDDEFGGRMVGAFSDRTIVTTHSLNDVQDGHRRYALRSPNGEFLERLSGPPEPRSESVLRVEVPGAGGASSQFAQTNVGTCFPRTMSVVVPNAMIVAEPESGVVYSIDRNGTQSVVYRTDYREVVTQEMVDGLQVEIGRVGRIPQTGGEQAKEVTGAMERLGAPGSPMPTLWGGILRDAGGEQVWLRHANCHFRPIADRWDVIDLGLGAIAEVTVPIEMWLLAISADRVLARTRSELGVEYVGVYPLER